MLSTRKSPYYYRGFLWALWNFAKSPWQLYARRSSRPLAPRRPDVVLVLVLVCRQQPWAGNNAGTRLEHWIWRDGSLPVSLEQQEDERSSEHVIPRHVSPRVTACKPPCRSVLTVVKTQKLVSTGILPVCEYSSATLPPPPRQPPPALFVKTED